VTSTTPLSETICRP